MKYRIAFFCPDQHITYNLHTLNQAGVGGGITARVRMAHALARQGHQVQLFVNCLSSGHLSGVDYFHFSQLNTLDTDIFIVTTSGGGMDLSGIVNKDITARLKILFIHGDPRPIGFDDLPFNKIYSPSNFIARTVADKWGLASRRLFVTHHGVEEDLFNGPWERRDEFRLIYAGHPSKGLDTALEILRILRTMDPRFTLDIYGGYQLWGQQQDITLDQPGVTFQGLIGQQQLAKQLKKSGFCINLQAREEPFGMVITESMRAGCIALASPVGAFPEIITNGANGFLVPGDHAQAGTREFAAQLIMKLVKNASYAEYVRKNAMHSPLSWQRVAQTWEGHWDWALSNSAGDDCLKGCSLCGGRLLLLADGLHCIDCGNYQRSVPNLSFS